MLFYRLLASSIRSGASFFARTTISPTSNLIIPPSTLSPKSVIILATPQNIPAVIESAILLTRNQKLQVVVAGVERVVPNGVSNGISELWMDDRMKIGRLTLLCEKDKAEPLRVSDGVNPVSAKVNWKNLDASLELDIQDTQICMALANTAFYTNLLSTLFFLDREATENTHSGQTLCGLQVVLPALQTNFEEATIHDNWTPLGTLGNDGVQLVVTSCAGNLLKRVNQLPASLFLENNKTLMSVGSKDTKVYVKVHGKKGPIKRYEVIAGGGGWGARADLLALSPEAKLNKGDRVEFFMVRPGNQTKMRPGVISNQFLFECVEEANTYGEDRLSTQRVDNLFGCGSERGFVSGSVNHKSPGESLLLRFS